MKTLWKSMRCTYCLVGAGFLLCVVAAILLLDIGGYQRRGYVRASIRGHAITYTESRMSHLADLIRLVTADFEHQPPREIAALPEFFQDYSPELAKWLVAEPLCIDPNTGSFPDSWGNQIRVTVQSENHYRFISPGPNGKDENGEGDDIVYDFDPWELVQRMEPNEPNNS